MNLWMNYWNILNKHSPILIIWKASDVLNPSIQDKKLILCSKDEKCPMVSNDLDLHFSVRIA